MAVKNSTHTYIHTQDGGRLHGVHWYPEISSVLCHGHNRNARCREVWGTECGGAGEGGTGAVLERPGKVLPTECSRHTGIRYPWPATHKHTHARTHAHAHRGCLHFHIPYASKYSSSESYDPSHSRPNWRGAVPYSSSLLPLSGWDSSELCVLRTDRRLLLLVRKGAGPGEPISSRGKPCPVLTTPFTLY